MAPVVAKSQVENEMPVDLQHSDPTHEEIAVLAYALWQERGCPDGSPDDDWLKAERQLITSQTK